MDLDDDEEEAAPDLDPTPLYLPPPPLAWEDPGRERRVILGVVTSRAVLVPGPPREF